MEQQECMTVAQFMESEGVEETSAPFYVQPVIIAVFIPVRDDKAPPEQRGL